MIYLYISLGTVIDRKSWAVLFSHPENPCLWLIVPCDLQTDEKYDETDIKHDPFIYMQVKMPAIVLRLRKCKWLSENEIKKGMRDGYITPFFKQRAIEVIAAYGLSKNDFI
jgi:hypothetical protein